jgi:hypothetical protein
MLNTDVTVYSVEHYIYRVTLYICINVSFLIQLLSTRVGGNMPLFLVSFWLLAVLHANNTGQSRNHSLLITSGFWPRVRARALRAPIFLD